MEEHIKREPYKARFYMTLVFAVAITLLFIVTNLIIVDQSNMYMDLAKDNDVNVKTIYDMDNKIKDKDKEIGNLQKENKELLKKHDSQPK